MTSPEGHGIPSRMARGGVVTLGGSVITRIVGAATVIVLVRHFSVEDFAAYSFGLAFATFFSTLSDFGLDAVIIRELAADPDDRDEILGSAVVAKTLAVIGSGVVGALVALLYEGTLQTAALVGTLSVFQAVASTHGLTLSADLRLTPLTAIKLGGQVVAAAAAVVLALTGGGPMLVLGVQTAIGFIPGVLLYVYVRRRRTFTPRVVRSHVTFLLRASVPVAGATLAVVIFARVDQLLLGALGSTEDLAVYGAVVRVVDLLNFVPIALTAVVLPPSRPWLRPSRRGCGASRSAVIGTSARSPCRPPRS